MKRNKTHYIKGCVAPSSNVLYLTPLLTEVTCGSCKGMVLEKIREMDWNDLPQEVLDFFWKIADQD